MTALRKYGLAVAVSAALSGTGVQGYVRAGQSFCTSGYIVDANNIAESKPAYSSRLVSLHVTIHSWATIKEAKTSMLTYSFRFRTTTNRRQRHKIPRTVSCAKAGQCRFVRRWQYVLSLKGAHGLWCPIRRRVENYQYRCFVTVGSRKRSLWRLFWIRNGRKWSGSCDIWTDYEHVPAHTGSSQSHDEKSRS